VTRWRTASALALATIGGWVLYTFPPISSRFYPQCVFRQLTGLDCPGCGTTRALHHLLHGRVSEAFALNPMLFALMIVALCAVPSFIRGQRPRFLDRPWFGWGSFVVVTGWWVGRNL
jgi:hypothetical protein